jgi:hypothetical protein
MFLERVMKNSYDRGVSAAEDPDDASAAAAVGAGRRELNQHLITLHGAIHLIWRNEDIIVPAGLARFRAHKPKAVAMYIQTAGKQVAAVGGKGEGPVIAVGFDQFAAGGHAVELFQQHAALPASTEAQLAHQLLIPGALAGRAFNAVKELAVSHFGSFGAGSHKSHQRWCLC